MNRKTAYKLLESMISAASKELVKFTSEQKLSVEKKPDKTVVTRCDEHISKVLVDISKQTGLGVISEECENSLEVVKSGNYIIIDPIDGTLAYIKHVTSALELGLENPCVDPTLGREWHYSLLVGIVIDGKPRFGCCYNYVTGEKILLDSESRDKVIWEGGKYNPAKNAYYIDNRTFQNPEHTVNRKISKMDYVETIRYGSLGLGMLYAQLNQHDSSVIVHYAQQNGLWDILPACVAAEFSGAKILDGNGNPIKYNKYILIPGKGVSLFVGDKFTDLIKELK